MTASQSLKIYEILSAQFAQPEKARELTEAIEAAIDERVDTKLRVFQSAFAKDFEVLRSDLSTRIADSKADLLKWMIGMFIPLYLSIIGLFVAILLKR